MGITTFAQFKAAVEKEDIVMHDSHKFEVKAGKLVDRYACSLLTGKSLKFLDAVADFILSIFSRNYVEARNFAVNQFSKFPYAYYASNNPHHKLYQILLGERLKNEMSSPELKEEIYQYVKNNFTIEQAESFLAEHRAKQKEPKVKPEDRKLDIPQIIESAQTSQAFIEAEKKATDKSKEKVNELEKQLKELLDLPLEDRTETVIGQIKTLNEELQVAVQDHADLMAREDNAELIQTLAQKQKEITIAIDTIDDEQTLEAKQRELLNVNSALNTVGKAIVQNQIKESLIETEALVKTFENILSRLEPESEDYQNTLNQINEANAKATILKQSLGTV
jgi:hypothetical protein